MGGFETKQTIKPKLSSKQIEYLKKRTRMNEDEIEKWFQEFHKDCPDGLLTQKHFIEMYNQAFPNGNATQYAKRVFVTFDKDNSGKIDFNEFLLAMDLFEKGDLDEKLNYAFELYDIDKNGILTKSEIEIIIKMVLSLRGEGNNDRLKDDIITHLNRFITKFDENGDMKITPDEFSRICSQDEYLRLFLSPNFSS
ncbi:unnamed protein product [Rotaria sordida]|uniref:EF-hand domain-containing protein n=1 Tax=Rotaria sordida TaxID=392033 RepID=A0A814BNS1_9BILA|nr:unnamed protein product [Rotaria sordida]CAF0955378.1 unnamed protein product [Rotaria sordida]CAF0986524.1 unnamed protein product [Rotaria sordida]CAF1077021.1 unnamed protein product [Rotaria sordida]CAF1077616.1 unnamed protein product [Rotaria sordida]